MPGGKGENVRFGAFEVYFGTGEVRRDGNKVKLQDQPFAVLALLLERRGELVTREEFRERIWGTETYVDFDQALNKAIKNIRAALGDSAEQPTYIETLPKRGYRFIAPLHSAQYPGDGSDADPTAQDVEKANLNRSTQPNTDLGEVRNTPTLPRFTRNRRIALIAGAFAVSLGLLFLLIRHNGEPEPELRLRRLTTNSSENSVGSPQVSPDGKYLLYGDQLGIHVRVIATGEIHTYKRPAAVSDRDSWSPTTWFPDQTHFLAVSESLTSQGVMPASWVVSMLGDEVTKIRDKACAQAVSPDGSLIAFTTGGTYNNQEIWVMGTSGEDPKLVAKLDAKTEKDHWYCCLGWSPDGRRLLDLNVHFVPTINTVSSLFEGRDLRRGGAVPIIRNWRGWGTCQILIDGRLICIESKPAKSSGEKDETNLVQMRINPETGELQGKARQLTHWSGDFLVNLSASRDGKTLVLQKLTQQAHTYLGELVGPSHPAALRRLTLEESDDLPFAWTPDSKAVLFLTNRTGAYRLYKQSIDEEIAELVNTGPGVVGEARVSPDGQWIIYRVEAEKGGPSRLMKVAVSGGPPQLIKELGQLGNIGCLSAPTPLCAVVQDDGHEQVVSSIDPTTGQTHVLFKLPDQDNEEQVSLDFGIGLIRRDVSGTRIRLLSPTGSLKREIDTTPWSSVSGLDWTSNGRELYTTSVGPRGTTILQVDLPGGKIQPLWFLRGSQYGWAIPAPDGRHLAVIGTSMNSNVWLVESF